MKLAVEAGGERDLLGDRVRRGIDPDEHVLVGRDRPQQFRSDGEVAHTLAAERRDLDRIVRRADAEDEVQETV